MWGATEKRAFSHTFFRATAQTQGSAAPCLSHMHVFQVEYLFGLCLLHGTHATALHLVHLSTI